ncbi:Probable carbohydrate esterase At4g34215 [Linum perenne]
MEWERASEPLHMDIDVGKNKTCGVGPGMAFANAMLLNNGSGIVVGLVPCAVGGTRIRQWRRGRRLYRGMVARARAAAASNGGKIRGLLWYQGESDTVRREDAEGYKGRLEKLILDVRSDLGIPTLPLLLVCSLSFFFFSFNLTMNIIDKIN